MKIHLLREHATPEQVAEMLEELGTYVKLAVDVKRGIVAGGGEWHADCEQVLLNDGSQQQDLWGANWYPEDNVVSFEALMNIRPHQNNRTLVIQDETIRTRIEQIVRSLFA